MLTILLCFSIQSDGTALHVAVRNGNIEIVELLIDGGIDVNIPETFSGL